MMLARSYRAPSVSHSIASIASPIAASSSNSSSSSYSAASACCAARMLHSSSYSSSSSSSTPHPRIIRSSPSSSYRSFHSGRPRSAEAAKRDYYEVLNVSKSADKSDVKKAFYKLAKQYHPDTNKAADAQSKFAEINNAYEILSDPEKRKRYDAMGHDAEQMHQQGGSPGGFSHEDVLRDFFGMGGGGPRGGQQQQEDGPQRGADIETSLHLSFMEAVQGVSKQLYVSIDVPCAPCDGSGSQPKSTPSTCTECKGAGSVRVNQGFFQVQMTCRGCGGRGRRQPPCQSCSGSGVTKQRKAVDITVPAGADTESVLRLTGQGDAGKMNGPRGHIFVRLTIGSHAHFRRDGVDIHYDAPITMAQAALGASVAIPTLTGEVMLKVAPGTQPAEKRVMRGRGVKVLNRAAHGDQYVHFKVVVPSKMSKKAREALEMYGREMGEQANYITPPKLDDDPTPPKPSSMGSKVSSLFK